MAECVEAGAAVHLAHDLLVRVFTPSVRPLWFGAYEVLEEGIGEETGFAVAYREHHQSMVCWLIQGGDRLGERCGDDIPELVFQDSPGA